jgi:hypothetical protein
MALRESANSPERRSISPAEFIARYERDPSAVYVWEILPLPGAGVRVRWSLALLMPITLFTLFYGTGALAHTIIALLYRPVADGFVLVLLVGSLGWFLQTFVPLKLDAGNPPTPDHFIAKCSQASMVATSIILFLGTDLAKVNELLFERMVDPLSLFVYFSHSILNILSLNALDIFGLQFHDLKPIGLAGRAITVFGNALILLSFIEIGKLAAMVFLTERVRVAATFPELVRTHAHVLEAMVFPVGSAVALPDDPVYVVSHELIAEIQTRPLQ